MSIQSYIQPWQGEAVRHIPKLAQYNIYDFSYAGRSAEDDIEQWCLVLFLDKLPADVREFLPNVTIDGTFRIE